MALHPADRVLPHRGAMLLIDAIIARSDNSIITRAMPRRGMPFFVADRGLPAHVALEWMAQTCGAFIGGQAMDAGAPVRIGFLLGTRNFCCTTEWFAADQAFDTWARPQFLDGSMGVFDCGVRLAPMLTVGEGGADIATARLTVYQPPNTIGIA